MKNVLVLGAGGFIGNHLVNRLKAEGCYVRGADIKKPEFSDTKCDSFLQIDLRDRNAVNQCIDIEFDEVYQLAADMGGAGYLFTGENDANVMHNSALINLNVLDRIREVGANAVFYSSSACVYPEYNQLDPSNPVCAENTVYPAQPDSEYGWEKLFSERMYEAYSRNFGINCKVGRYHNIYGPICTWTGGREKAPAAICRKVGSAEDGEAIEIWGDGQQSRSFLFVDECVEGTLRLTRSDYSGPLNIGSEELVTINELTQLVIRISGKKLSVKHIKGPIGVKGRNSDNHLIKKELNWAPSVSLETGMKSTYAWINQQLKRRQ